MRSTDKLDIKIKKIILKISKKEEMKAQSHNYIWKNIPRTYKEFVKSLYGHRQKI